MTSLFDSLPPALGVFVEVALKGTLLMAAAATVIFALRGATATMRHMLWSFTLVAMLVIPALIVVLPRWQVDILPTPSSRFPAAMADPVIVKPRASAAVVQPTAKGMSTLPAPDAGAVLAADNRKFTIDGTSLLFLWIGGIATGLITIAGGVLALRRIARRATALENQEWTTLVAELSSELGLIRNVRLLRSDYAAMPATWGIFNPVVLLPVGADEWDEDRRRAVLLHELAHVKRNDCLTQLIAQLSCAVYWFHPGVWYTARRVRAERELACDEQVLGVGVNACDYAAHLIEIARSCRSPAGPAIAVAMARSSQLEGRLHAILDERAGSGWRSSRAMRRVTLAALAVSTLPLAAMRPWRSSDSTLSSLPSLTRALDAVSAQDTFRWQGSVPRGKWVEVLTVIGDLRAEPSNNGKVEILAVRKSGTAGSYRIAVDPSDGGMRFCVVRASARSARPCRTRDGGNLADGMTDVRVDFLMKIPAGVGVSAHTVRGNIAADDMKSYVWGTSGEGDISIVTSDLAEASTRSGSIAAEFGRRSWKQDLEFLTDNGDVTVVAPSDARMHIQMETGGGTIRSQFPSTSARFGSGQRSTASIGSGGGMLTLRTGRGRIELKRGANAVADASDMDFAYTDAPAASVDPKPNPDEDPAFDVNPNPDPHFDPNPDPNPNPDPKYDPDPNPQPEYDPDPNINAHVDDDPTQERVPVVIPEGFVNRFSDAAIRGWKDAAEIRRLRAIAADHVKQHPADLVRERAAWALTLVRNGEVVTPLLAALRDKDWRIRAYAAWAMSETRDSRGTAAVTSALGDVHWRVRMHAASALQRLGDSHSVVPLINALSDETWQVRISAIDALARIGDRRALPALKRVAQADSRSFVRDEAQNAIQRIE
jgi:beta-lactamase regulating signal transducer with metallopeptidase domain